MKLFKNVFAFNDVWKDVFVWSIFELFPICLLPVPLTDLVMATGTVQPLKNHVKIGSTMTLAKMKMIFIVVLLKCNDGF